MVSAWSAKVALWDTGHPPLPAQCFPRHPKRQYFSLLEFWKGSSTLFKGGLGWPCPALSCVRPFCLLGLPECLEVQVAPGLWAPQTSVHPSKDCWGPRGASLCSTGLVLRQTQLARTPPPWAEPLRSW